jgi:hypothetical protein
MNKILSTILQLSNEGWNMDEELSELYQLKSSCCKNCKYSKQDKRDAEYLVCTNESDIMPYEDGAILLNVHKDFCCNQWKSK